MGPRPANRCLNFKAVVPDTFLLLVREAIGPLGRTCAPMPGPEKTTPHRIPHRIPRWLPPGHNRESASPGRSRHHTKLFRPTERIDASAPAPRSNSPVLLAPRNPPALKPTGNFQPAPCIDRFLGGAIRPAKLRVHHRVDCGSDLGRLVPCVRSGASLPMDRGHVLPHGNSTTASIVATRAVAPGRIHHPRQPGGFPPSGKGPVLGIPPPAWCGRLSRQP